MPNAKKTPLQTAPAPAQTIGIVLFDQFSNHCLANTVEPLRAANSFAGRTLYRWSYLSLNGGPVTSSSGLPVMAQARLSDHAGDMLMLLPSYGHLRLTTPALLAGLRAAATRHRILAGLDMGAWMMAAAGLLDDQPATIHWDEVDAFAEAFPAVDVTTQRYVVTDTRITCGGAAAAFDLILQLIHTRHGLPLRLEVAGLFGQGDPDRAAPPPRPGGRTSGPVDAATTLMRRTVETPLTIADIARAVGLSQRALEQRFRAQLDAAPQHVYRQIRLGVARRLVQASDMPIIEIAGRCGYRNASALTRAFRTAHGITPRDLRRTHK